MNIKINGKAMDVGQACTLDGLLDLVGVKRQGIAVELNREIVPKRLHGETPLKDGDSVEIVRMVGGG